MYWGLGEGARVVSAWIAIDDSSPDNGCMRAVRTFHLALLQLTAYAHTLMWYPARVAGGRHPSDASTTAWNVGWR